MPIHDWTRVPAGLFHDFHQSWTVQIAQALNRGCLPKGLSALIEHPSAFRGHFSGVTVDPPVPGIDRRTTEEGYAGRANRIVVRRRLSRIVAVIEILSPGNKDSRAALRDFVGRTVEFLSAGIHVLVVDLFPPTPCDPFGIHKAIWDEIEESDFAFPDGKDRIMASYEMGNERAAYVEPIAVGDPLGDMPLFLSQGHYVSTPLEPTYQATWDASPEVLRTAVETGVLPEADPE
jgi:hypothetical protein